MTFNSVDGRVPVHSFYSAKSWIEGSAVQQLDIVAALPTVKAVVAMPDLHPGKFGPVGCGILSEAIYPQFVGSDIGCGMGLYRLNLTQRKLKLDKAAERLRVLDEPWDGNIEEALTGAGLAPTSFDGALGSIGGGNHFCEVQAIDEILDEEAAKAARLEKAEIYLLVHSGSRGLGFSILDRLLAEGVTRLEAKSEAAIAYLADHDRALRWAELNRRVLALRVGDALRADGLELANVSHNFVEEKAGGFLHRKGAAPADKGLVPIPGSREALSYLVEPRPTAPAAALQCLAHGAGRKYDRASMHGRIRVNKSTLSQLKRNAYGGVIVCEDRNLLLEEAGEAYKAADRVIADLIDYGLARVVATFKPLITFKTSQGSYVKKPRKSHREERR
jgi:release factor H-coupled RctB family protein